MSNLTDFIKNTDFTALKRYNYDSRIIELTVPAGPPLRAFNQSVDIGSGHVVLGANIKVNDGDYRCCVNYDFFNQITSSDYTWVTINVSRGADGKLVLTVMDHAGLSAPMNIRAVVSVMVPTI